MRASEISLENYRSRTFVYGQPGSAKSWFAATSRKPYIFDFDCGALTFKQVMKATGKNVSFDSYPLTMGTYERVIAKLELVKKDPEVETIVFDSLTTWQSIMIEWLLRNNSKTQMTLELWGVFIRSMEDFFGTMALIQKNIVMTGHQVHEKDEVTGEILTLPLVSGKQLPTKIPLWFDEVYHTEVRQAGTEFIYELITRASTRYSARSRLGLPNKIKADFAVIEEFVAKELAEERATKAKEVTPVNAAGVVKA